jgi:hypothetical protein
VPDTYVPNPRHKQPWQPGARGTLCPKGVDGAALLKTATADPNHPNKRYNTDGECAYCAHSSSRNVADGEQEVVWHGFPINWRDVPAAVQRQWIADGLLARLRLRG